MKYPLDFWNPTREFEGLRRHWSRFFDDWPSETAITTKPETFFNPACDIDETDTHYLMTFDLPGVSKDDVKVEVNDNRVRVYGEKNEERKEKKNGRRLVERQYGSFERSFTLPSQVDAAKVEAQFTDGVLKITVPKTMLPPAHQIKIADGKSASGANKKEQH